jgi:pilus assembly protein TadC
LETPAARRRRGKLVDELPAALDLLSAMIAAGLPLRAAVRELVDASDGPLAEDLRAVIAQIDLGRSDVDAWRSLRDHPALGGVSVDLARSVQSGTMITATLHRHATIARRDRRGEREARARTVGVKSVPPLMLCFVPAFLLISIVPIVASGILAALR